MVPNFFSNPRILFLNQASSNFQPPLEINDERITKKKEKKNYLLARESRCSILNLEEGVYPVERSLRFNIERTTQARWGGTEEKIGGRGGGKKIPSGVEYANWYSILYFSTCFWGIERFNLIAGHGHVSPFAKNTAHVISGLKFGSWVGIY